MNRTRATYNNVILRLNTLVDANDAFTTSVNATMGRQRTLINAPQGTYDVIRDHNSNPRTQDPLGDHSSDGGNGGSSGNGASA